jgi:hypothetical protein
MQLPGAYAAFTASGSGGGGGGGGFGYDDASCSDAGAAAVDLLGPAAAPQGQAGKAQRAAYYEALLQNRMAREDARVRELTEGVLYDFLPAALAALPPAPAPAPTDAASSYAAPPASDQSRAVASAVISLAALLNAPPGFLEFLLCMPWARLADPPPPQADGFEPPGEQFEVDAAERAAVVNGPIHPALLPLVLDFVLSGEHAAGLPPMLLVRAPACIRALHFRCCSLLRVLRRLLSAGCACCCTPAGELAAVHVLNRCPFPSLCRALTTRRS